MSHVLRHRKNEEKVIVTDLEHVEIVWKFKDEVRKFIGI